MGRRLRLAALDWAAPVESVGDDSDKEADDEVCTEDVDEYEEGPYNRLRDWLRIEHCMQNVVHTIRQRHLVWG